MFEQVSETLLKNLERYKTAIRIRVFGVNNERLDFLMDSFYKLDPKYRNGVLFGGGAFVFLSVITVLFLYFSRIMALDDELNKTFLALNDFRRYAIEEKISSEKYMRVINTIDKKTSSLQIKPFFEKLAKDKKVEVKGITEKAIDLEASNALSEQVKGLEVEMKLPKISIPRLLKFLIEIEKAGHFLRVQDLKITGMYGTKLYFDTTIVIRGYKTGR